MEGCGGRSRALSLRAISASHERGSEETGAEATSKILDSKVKAAGFSNEEWARSKREVKESSKLPKA